MMRTPSRLIPAFVAAVLVLSACGSDDDSAADTVPVTDPDGSSSAASSDDGALVAPRPIQVSGSAGGDAAAAEAAPASDRAASDAGFAPYQITHFEVGEGLPALPDNQIGYVFEIANAATLNVDHIDALAAALGASGEATRHEDGYGSAWWTVGPDDGTAPSLTVYEDAQLSWYYSPAWATSETAPSAGCAVAGSVGAAEPAVAPEPDIDASATSATSAPAPSTAPAVDEMPVCETIPPPEGILSADEAEARTRELMTAVGLDPAGYTFEPYADDWYASASAAEQLDGGFTGRRFDAGFGANGELQSAGGQLASPAKAGPYDLIDLDTAIARLSDQTGFWGGMGGGIAIDSVARSTGGGVATPDIAEAPVSDVPVSDQAPPETVMPTEVTVTLVDVQADLWWVWDADGSVWLLPAYRFIGDDGGWYTVPAVSDEFLVQAPVPETTVTPIEPTIDSLPVETKPETGPTESIPNEAAPADTTLLEPYVGSPIDEFTAQAEALGYAVRITQQDGVDLAVTADFSPQRVNVAVDGDTVTKILAVG